MLWIIGLLSQEQTWKLNERAGNAFNPFQTSQSLSFLDFISSDEKNLKNEKIMELNINLALYSVIQIHKFIKKAHKGWPATDRKM